MMEIDAIAIRVNAVAGDVSAAAGMLRRFDPGPAAFAGAVPGQLGEVGRALHRIWSAGLAARERESATHGARLADLAAALRTAADRYRDIDDSADRRHRGMR